MKLLCLAVSGLVLSGSSFATMTMESEKYDMVKVNEVYQCWAELRDVDVKALRGDYFYPSEFWKRPVESVLDYLRPELDNCLIPGMSGKRLMRFSCFPVYPREELLKAELLLEEAVCNKIDVFMKGKSISFERDKYYECLKIGREKGDLDYEGKRRQATPLLTFFKPFTVHYFRWWTLKKNK